MQSNLFRSFTLVGLFLLLVLLMLIEFQSFAAVDESGNNVSITVIKDREPNDSLDIFHFTVTTGLEKPYYSGVGFSLMDEGTDFPKERKVDFRQIKDNNKPHGGLMPQSITEDLTTEQLKIFHVSYVCLDKEGSILKKGFGPQVDELYLDPTGSTSDIICTFKNSIKTSSITFTKELVPSSAEVFPFTVYDDTNQEYYNSFSLTGDSSDSATFLVGDIDKDETAYTVLEKKSNQDKYSVVYHCDNGDVDTSGSALKIIIKKYQNVVCKVTNYKLDGTLIIENNVLPNISGNIEFNVHEKNPSGKGVAGTPFSIANGSSISIPVESNKEYYIEEKIDNSKYKASYRCTQYNSKGEYSGNFPYTSPSVKILSSGDTLNCVFTNTRQSEITVIKKSSTEIQNIPFAFVIANKSTPKSPVPRGNFALLGNGTNSSKRTVALENNIAGDDMHYIVSENIDPSVYAGRYECEFTAGINGVKRDKIKDIGGAINDLVLSPGELASCTFTNAKTKATIVVIKDAEPDTEEKFKFDITHNGGQSDNGPFLLWDDGSLSTYNKRLDPTVLSGVLYTVTELLTGDQRYETSYSCAFIPNTRANISGSGVSVSLNLSLGEKAVCTFKNVCPVGTKCGYETPPTRPPRSS